MPANREHSRFHQFFFSRQMPFSLLLSYALENKVVFTDHLITEARNAPKWIFNDEKQLCIQHAKQYMGTLFEPTS
ncbi:hypothetical protein [Legionella tunisiensis]|uniref:hypothetical protein n=1 Tax=Legionella tunisiensis TaxID=1034944 RepID=UPI0012EAB8EA|nr:hypothetical protein [Legionella tunisiensis]